MELFWSPLSRIRTEYVSVSLRIQSECGKMLSRITPNTNIFDEVKALLYLALMAILIDNNIRDFSNFRTSFFFKNELQKQSTGCVLWKCVLKNFAKFTEIICARVSFYLKRYSGAVKFAKFLRTPSFLKHLRWLLPELKLSSTDFKKFTAKCIFNTMSTPEFFRKLVT